jgi:hypothetical protein
MFVIYVDDGILVSPDDNQLAEELKILQGAEGTLIDYVGVNIERTKDNKMHMSQPNIIRSIFSWTTPSPNLLIYSTKGWQGLGVPQGRLELSKSHWKIKFPILLV